MVFLFLDLPKSYKYGGAKNAIRRSISACEINRGNYDVTNDKNASNGRLGAELTVEKSVRPRSKSEYSLDKIEQKCETEACTNLRLPILLVTKENQGNDALATENKDMGNKESKDQVAKQQDRDADEIVVLETTDVKENAEKSQKTETKKGEKKRIAKDTKVVTKDKKSVVKETKPEKETVEENDLSSQINGFDNYELNEAGIAYMYGGRYQLRFVHIGRTRK